MHPSSRPVGKKGRYVHNPTNCPAPGCLRLHIATAKFRGTNESLHQLLFCLPQDSPVWRNLALALADERETACRNLPSSLHALGRQAGLQIGHARLAVIRHFTLRYIFPTAAWPWRLPPASSRRACLPRPASCVCDCLILATPYE